MFDLAAWLKDRAHMRGLARTRIAALTDSRVRLGKAAQGNITPAVSEGIPPTATADIQRLLTHVGQKSAMLQQLDQELSEVDAQIREAHSAIDTLESDRHRRLALDKQCSDLKKRLTKLRLRNLLIWFFLSAAGLAFVIILPALQGQGGIDYKSAKGRPVDVDLSAQGYVLQGIGDAGTERSRRNNQRLQGLPNQSPARDSNLQPIPPRPENGTRRNYNQGRRAD